MYVRRNNPGYYCRRLCGKDEILIVSAFYTPLGYLCLRPCGTLGMGFRRMAEESRGPYFAGGIVVHINAGISAIAVALIIGKRRGYNHKPTPPHNLPFTVLGAGLLWFGWFGFNAGSALAANGLATSAFVATNTAAAVAAFTWIVLEWIVNGTPTMFGTVTGAIAGLAAITPACGFVNPAGAMAIGFLGSALCFPMISIVKAKLGYDDSLDAFGVHGVSGIIGTLAVGLFATKAINPSGADGLFFGNSHQFMVQLIAVAVTVVYSLTATFVICRIVDVLTGLRVAAHDEIIGLDLTQHHEVAYTILE